MNISTHFSSSLLNTVTSQVSLGNKFQKHISFQPQVLLNSIIHSASSDKTREIPDSGSNLSCNIIPFINCTMPCILDKVYTQFGSNQWVLLYLLENRTYMGLSSFRQKGFNVVWLIHIFIFSARSAAEGLALLYKT